MVLTNLGKIFEGRIHDLADAFEPVVDAWQPSSPFYSFAHGMYAMGLQERRHFAKAERHADIALQTNPRDTWSTHAKIHIFGMQGLLRDGTHYLERTARHWDVANRQWHMPVVTHFHWHRAVMHFDLLEPERSLQVFDTDIRPHLDDDESDTLTLVDAAALLYRFQLEGFVSKILCFIYSPVSPL